MLSSLMEGALSSNEALVIEMPRLSVVQRGLTVMSASALTSLHLQSLEAVGQLTVTENESLTSVARPPLERSMRPMPAASETFGKLARDESFAIGVVDRGQ